MQLVSFPISFNAVLKKRALAAATGIGLVLSMNAGAAFSQSFPSGEQAAREALARAQAEKARNDEIVRQQERAREEERRAQEERVRKLEEAERKGRTG